ncbi:MAG: Crp/Fnr family transcriptional regulator [Cyanobacteria bacterium P01_H01_bin.121]
MTAVTTPTFNTNPRIRQRLETWYNDQAPQFFQSGQTIPLQPNKLWMVRHGVVILSTIYPSGEEALLGLAGPSTSFGLPLTLVHPYNAIALTSVDLASVSLADVERSPALSHELLQSAHRRLQQAEMILSLMGQRRVEDRLRQFLILLKQEVGQPTPQGIRLGVRLTHQHLASALGTTRVTITRLLGQLRREGWLQMDRSRHIVLPELAA